MAIVTTRPVETSEDNAFLFDLYAAGRAEEMNSLVDWTDEKKQSFLLSQFQARRSHYGKSYPDSQIHIIICDKDLAGSLWVDWSQGKLHILDLAILPLHQGQGLGSQLLDQLTREADRRNIVSEIATHLHNVGAQRLYEQFDFVKTNKTDTHIFYCREPKSR